MKQSENVFRAYCLGKYFPKNIFWIWMDRIFKIGLLSLEWQWGLLALIIIPIFFKNNVKNKTKISSIKTFQQLPLYSAKATHTWLLSMIINSRLRSQMLHFTKICSFQISSRNWSHIQRNLLKSGGFYRFSLNINVISFYFLWI